MWLHCGKSSACGGGCLFGHGLDVRPMGGEGWSAGWATEPEKMGQMSHLMAVIPSFIPFLFHFYFQKFIIT
jgi:hypothetical protein